MWLELLQDALESRDLDDLPGAEGRDFVHHPILSHFSKLATAALSVTRPTGA